MFIQVYVTSNHDKGVRRTNYNIQLVMIWHNFLYDKNMNFQMQLGEMGIYIPLSALFITLYIFLLGNYELKSYNKTKSRLGA